MASGTRDRSPSFPQSNCRSRIRKNSDRGVNRPKPRDFVYDAMLCEEIVTGAGAACRILTTPGHQSVHPVGRTALSTLVRGDFKLATDFSRDPAKSA